MTSKQENQAPVELSSEELSATQGGVGISAVVRAVVLGVVAEPEEDERRRFGRKKSTKRRGRSD